jgi:hypothetical protein
MWLENTDAFLQKYCHIHSSYLVSKGPSMSLPNNFNPQIYRSDLPVLFMARHLYQFNLRVLFMAEIFNSTFPVVEFFLICKNDR